VPILELLIQPKVSNMSMAEEELAKTLPLIAHANSKIKTKHPRLGYLNAKQWLRFIEIHLHHHLKQLNRIENSLAKP
jgi:hypothetical protein